MAGKCHSDTKTHWYRPHRPLVIPLGVSLTKSRETRYSRESPTADITTSTVGIQ